MKRSTGFSIVEVLVVVVVLALVGYLGYVGWNKWQDSKKSATADTNQVQTSGSVKPAKINSTSDLDSVAKQLDSTNLNDSSGTQAQSQTSF